MKISLRITLPDNFRRNDFLAFHQRDNLMRAERWDNKHLHKGIIWSAMPACITFTFSSAGYLSVTLDVDSGRRKMDTDTTKTHLRTRVNHMLGLNQATEAFEKFAATHPDLKMMTAMQSGLRVPQSATPFEALSWPITGQQISVNADVSLRRKLIERTGIKHSSGILCYPDPQHVTQLSEEDLRQCSFSTTKARTLINLARLIHSGKLPVNQWLETYHLTQQLPAENIYTELVQIKGIGPWTIHYALLRGFGWLDGSLHGDVAVRRNLQQLLIGLKKFNTDGKISELETQQWLAGFSPWRALVAAHLWAMQKNDGY